MFVGTRFIAFSLLCRYLRLDVIHHVSTSLLCRCLGLDALNRVPTSGCWICDFLSNFRRIWLLHELVNSFQCQVDTSTIPPLRQEENALLDRCPDGKSPGCEIIAYRETLLAIKSEGVPGGFYRSSTKETHGAAFHRRTGGCGDDQAHGGTGAARTQRRRYLAGKPAGPAGIARHACRSNARRGDPDWASRTRQTIAFAQARAQSA